MFQVVSGSSDVQLDGFSRILKDHPRVQPRHPEHDVAVHGVKLQRFASALEQALAVSRFLVAYPQVVNGVVALGLAHAQSAPIQAAMFSALTGSSDAQKAGFLEVLSNHPALDPKAPKDDLTDLAVGLLGCVTGDDALVSDAKIVDSVVAFGIRKHHNGMAQQVLFATLDGKSPAQGQAFGKMLFQHPAACGEASVAEQLTFCSNIRDLMRHQPWFYDDRQVGNAIDHYIMAHRNSPVTTALNSAYHLRQGPAGRFPLEGYDAGFGQRWPGSDKPSPK